MIDTSFLKHLDRLSVIINKKVTSNFIGERRSIHSGYGTIFKDHTLYSPGDDYRRIDWRVFARTDKLHTKRFEEEKNLVVHILVDSSASMNFGSAGTTKFEYGAMLGIGLAYMALKNNEKFVLSTFSDKLEPFKPSRGRGQLVAILDYLKNKQAGGVSRFEEALRNYSKLIKSRSLIVILSDFLYDVEDVKRVIYTFKNHDVKLIQVLDDLEVGLNIKGEFKFKDLETKGFLKTFVGPFLRKHYLTRLDEHKRKLNWVANSLGARFYSISTNKLIYDAFNEILRD
ncbi:MAG: DUF58 domain-containing protein [Nanoarchaeota archaeon]